MRGLPTLLLLASACAAAAHGGHHKPWWSHYEGVKKFRKKVFDDVVGTWEDFKSQYVDGNDKCDKAKWKNMEKNLHDLEKCQRKKKAAEVEAKRLERRASECEAKKRECRSRTGEENEARARLAATKKELETEVRRQENMKLLVERDLEQERAASAQLRRQLQEVNDARVLLGQRLAEELARDSRAEQGAQESTESAVTRMEAVTEDLEELAEALKRRHDDSHCDARPHSATASAALEAERQRSVAELARLTSDLEKASQEASELRAQLDAAKQKITGLELVMLLSPTAQESTGVPSVRLACCVALTTLLGVLCLVLANKVVGLEDQVRGAEKQTLEAAAEAERLREELDSEFGEMLKVDGQMHDSGSPFAWHIFDEKAQDRTSRFIKIQCPGVRHCDVEVHIVFNGCVLTIKRPASRGVKAATWRQRFQFRPSDGLFEFKEDQTVLEHGILQFVFSAYTHQSRMFRFPQHFDLAGLDFDGNWTLTPRETEQHIELPQEAEDAIQEPTEEPAPPAPFDFEQHPPQVSALLSGESTTVAALLSSEVFEQPEQKEKQDDVQDGKNMDGDEGEGGAAQEDAEESKEDEGGSDEEGAEEEEEATSSEVDDSEEDHADREMDVGQATELDKFAMEEAAPLLAAAADDDERRGALGGSLGGSAAGSSLGDGSFQRLELSRPRLEDEGSEASSSSCASFEKVQADAY